MLAHCFRGVPASVPNEGVPIVEAQTGATSWPSGGLALLSEIEQQRKIALVTGNRPSAIQLTTALASLVDDKPASVTERALADPPAHSESDLLGRLGERFLFDLECLCWRPWWSLDPLRLLGRLANERGIIVVWPGTVAGSAVQFSAPGRPDYVRVSAAGIVVLRPVATKFPDEIPFTIERIRE